MQDLSWHHKEKWFSDGERVRNRRIKTFSDGLQLTNCQEFRNSTWPPNLARQNNRGHSKWLLHVWSDLFQSLVWLDVPSMWRTNISSALDRTLHAGHHEIGHTKCPTSAYGTHDSITSHLECHRRDTCSAHNPCWVTRSAEKLWECICSENIVRMDRHYIDQMSSV